MRGEHVNIEVANLMFGPSSSFNVRVFSLLSSRFHDEYVSDISSELLPFKRFRVRFPAFAGPVAQFHFSPGIGRK